MTCLDITGHVADIYPHKATAFLVMIAVVAIFNEGLGAAAHPFAQPTLAAQECRSNL